MNWRLTMRQVAESITIDDFAVLVKTVSGEAEDQTEDGRTGVIHSILNRVRKQTYYGKTVSEVCLYNANNDRPKDEAYSCWGEGSSIREKIEAITYLYAENWALIQVVKHAIMLYLSGVDITNGSTHYKVVGTFAFWAKGHTPAITIDDHEFYNDVR